jgi:hypothetical protein
MAALRLQGSSEVSAVKWVTARAGGHCRTCTQPIAKGDRIGIVNSKWHHRSCLKPTGDALETQRLMTMKPADRVSLAIANADEAARAAALPARQRRLARMDARQVAHNRQIGRNLAFYEERRTS